MSYEPDSNFGGRSTTRERYRREIIQYVESVGGECETQEIIDCTDVPRSTLYKVIKKMEDEGRIKRGSSVTNPLVKTVVIPDGE